jgi:hypothetical protein
MNNKPLTDFLAEIKKTGSRKTASGDIEYQIILVSDDPQLMALAMVPANQLIRVIIHKPIENDTI